MLRAVLILLALLTVHAAAAQEMASPHILPYQVDWQAAAASLTGQPGVTPAASFATLNAASKSRFPDIDKSSVPVLLPLDIDALRKAQADKPEVLVDSFMRGGFHATAFFQAGPSGFDAAFSLRTGEVKELSDIRYGEPAYVLFSGFAMVYELDGRPLPDGEAVKELEGEFTGIRRVLHEDYVRYSFQRFGVIYVAAIYCRDTRPRPKLLSCKQADRIAERFLRALKTAGGTPTPERATVAPVALDRPQAQSKDFTYFGPGNLIPGTGLKKDLGGRADYTVYAQLRFPMKAAPAFANSQSFNNWGDCDFTGRSRGRLRGKGTPYSCKVNGRPLVFDESKNYAYPWRDNFCEHRRFFVGQCPGGEGHQGQDIRPSNCTMFNEGADRCKPYQHDIVAAHDGVILRAHKQEAVYLFINTPTTHMRVRYMHMNPNQLDGDGIVSGKQVAAGETIGKVGNYNKKERGTTYHLHFDMQVATRVGFVFVNPYMSLV
ncbi:MAG: peptidoglycan DD-metalloendopeptidase family protein, partial [Rhizobiales bacterium]|nr:peptidoglycan DD-metalloendopeptidase family protein [Hyphomicrobiales bacterium]